MNENNNVNMPPVVKSAEQGEAKKLIDLTFLDVMDEFGPESDEVQKLSKNGEENKIISVISLIINGNDAYKRADLRRELRGLSDYKKGALMSLVNFDKSLDEETKEKIRTLVE